MLSYPVKLLLILLSIPSPKKQLTNFRSFNLKIEIADDIRPELVTIQYDDGATRKELLLKKGQRTVNLSHPFYTKYATISIFYQLTDEVVSADFWIGTKKSSIKILKFNKAKYNQEEQYNRLQSQLENAFNVHYNGEMQYLNFTEKEKHTLKEFEKNNMLFLTWNDTSVIKAYLATRKSLDLKSLAFIKDHKNIYYSLWLMNNKLKYIGDGYDERYSGPSPGSLISFFNKNFSTKAKNSFEGREILDYLNAKALKYQIAPNFRVLTKTNDTLKLSNYKKKYVILNFWATWCVPCIKEIPALVAIREKISASDLVIISMSLDTKNINIDSAAKTHKMSWLNAYSTEKVMKDYGITGIPEILLIDPDGRVIYKRNEETEDIYSLPKLKSILATIMKK